MVCKDEICTWFKNLSPHKRIDYMCGMLQMCLPMELRFLGSFVEDLAKKDFHQLREHEGKANNRHEVSKISETGDKGFRTKMAIYLALLHSSNRTCSNIIFKLLESHVQEALTVVDSMDVMTVHSILLVLSMAMNHPAFSYHQKSTMYEYYQAASYASERIHNKSLPEQELLILSESCDMRSCDQRLSPLCSPGVPQMHLLTSPAAPSSQHSNSSPVQEKVYVCEIEIKGCRQRDKEKNTIEYIIQVTWSNGERKNVFKTYKELVNFHQMLTKKFPEDMLALKLPSIQRTQNHKKENRDHLNEYALSLSELPEYIRQTYLFASFFETTLHRPMTDACTSPRPPVVAPVPVVQQLPNSGEEETVIDQQYIGQPVSQNLYTSYIPQSPITGDMCNLSPHSPAHHELAYQPAALSPLCSTKTTSPLISSPCHSPVSSMESLANSVPGSPSIHDREDTSQQKGSKPGTRPLVPEERVMQQMEPAILNSQNNVGLIPSGLPSCGPEDFSVPALLKFNNLAPYAELFVGYTLEQVASMRNEDIEKMGVPKDDVEAIRNAVFPKLREKQPPYLNGVIEPAPQAGMMWQPPFLHPLHSLGPIPALHYPPAPFQQLFHYQPFQEGPGMVPGAQDLSPTNSEYSSPSPSPHLPQLATVHKPQLQRSLTDSSSEDGERDKQPGQYRGGVKSKGHSAHSARGNCLEKTTEINHDTNSNSGTPPLANEKCDSNENNAGNKGNSGYNSDPTSTRPLLRTYKAQPAHTSNIQPHSKMVINMPESNFKSVTQPFVQMIVPQQMRDVNMATNSVPQGYSMSPADLGHRSMLYFPQGQAVFSRSHFNQVNVTGSRPMFHPAAAVNQSMIAAQQTVMNGNAPIGTKGKVFPGSQAVVPPSPLPVTMAGKSPSVLMNGIDNLPINQPQTSEMLRSPATPVVVSSASSSSITVTHTSCGQTVTTNRPTLCSTCGCTGQHVMQQPAIQVIPQIHASMWHPPYNGLLPGHTQMQHMYPNHMSYPNGLSHEFLCNPAMYGMSHSSSQGLAGVPNVIYNNYNNHPTTSGGYSQKKQKKLNCHNCGSPKHLAADCTELSMEAVSGHMMYSYRPKNESD